MFFRCFWKADKYVLQRVVNPASVAASSVDAETEAAIQDAVESILADRISVVIAHRLSTIRRADLILLLDQGRVVERGSHDELMALGGRYRTLYLDQFVDEEERRVLG